MAKTSKPVVKKEVKTTSESSRKVKNALHIEKIKNPNLDKILSEAETLIKSGIPTESIRAKLMNTFSITKSSSTVYIKRVRKKLKVYNYGDLPNSIKADKDSSFKQDLEKSIKNCPSLTRFFKSEIRNQNKNQNNKKGN